MTSGSMNLQVSSGSGGGTCSSMVMGQGASLNGFRPFPNDNAWNQDISTAPVDPNSNAIINFIGAGIGVHADFGAGLYQGSSIGIPYVTAGATQSLVDINFTVYGDESDPGPMPVPANAPIEGYPNPGTGYRHVLVLDNSNCFLYALFSSYPGSGGAWNANSAAVWDLLGDEQRPWTWTSAGAAGLSIFAGLVRYDEAAGGAINHARRFTLQHSRAAFVPPASHGAASSSNSLAADRGGAWNERGRCSGPNHNLHALCNPSVRPHNRHGDCHSAVNSDLPSARLHPRNFSKSKYRPILGLAITRARVARQRPSGVRPATQRQEQKILQKGSNLLHNVAPSIEEILMKRRTVIRSSWLAMVITTVAAASAGPGVMGSVPSRDPASKVEPQLIAETAEGQSASFIVLLDDQADLSVAYNIEDPDARGWYVYRRLKEHAESTQARLRALLEARGVPYRSFWAANALVAYGDRDLIRALALSPEVRVIESNRSVRVIDDPPLETVSVPADPTTPEWGVQNVNAPQVWDLGFTGQGIVIGNEDTGIEWSHPALAGHYRGSAGLIAEHNYNWHDAIHDSVGNPCGNDSRFPCDDSSHGTHTTGTTSGDDGAGNQIGVAPGAQWIGCRNMDRGNGTPARYTECMEFFIAPTDLDGNNPDPSQRPHVINNSWVCPPSEGCAPETLQVEVENVQAAGIFFAASAGNSGPQCETVNAPPAIYDSAFSVGAYDIGDNLAGFSSRGPVTVDGSGRMKPDIAAPGVNVRSSIPGGRYGVLSGTSMAGPHVVGSVALLWSARPELQRQIQQTKDILRQTANPNISAPAQSCGGVPSSHIPNNSFGYGAVDALAAINAP